MVPVAGCIFFCWSNDLCKYWKSNPHVEHPLAAGSPAGGRSATSARSGNTVANPVGAAAQNMVSNGQDPVTSPTSLGDLAADAVGELFHEHRLTYA